MQEKVRIFFIQNDGEENWENVSWLGEEKVVYLLPTFKIEL